MNPAASAFPVACCGVSDGEHYYSLWIEDSPQFTAESFNCILTINQKLYRCLSGYLDSLCRENLIFVSAKFENE